ncbi:MAG: hypothetical protein GC186_08020 [Rhodobacteraceae bacterium]|nr:hypothetical protein [Paracoccaceae bacterium]
MQFLDPNDPFFRPVWRRWATVLVPAAWSCLELWGGNASWALLFGAAAAYAFWMLILRGPTG